MFMDLLDGGVLNVALPEIQQEMGASSAALQWMVAGYALSFALGLITGGRLGDIYGRKRVFVIGMALFTLTSVLCSVAQSPGQLVAARVAQGLAASLMVPQVMATIQVMYAPSERGRPITAAGALYAITSVLGPIIGALLTESDIAGLGWRTIFLVNVPVGVIALIAAIRYVPESRSETAVRLDLAGVLLAGLAMLLLLYPLVAGREAGWPAWTFVSMAASLPVFAIFVAHQRRKVDSPLVPLSLFRHGSFTGGLLILLLAMGGVVGFFLVFTVYLQDGLGYDVMRAGVTGIWWGIASSVFAALAINLLAARMGRLVVQIGLLTVVAGLLGLMWVTRSLDAEVTPGSLVVPLLLGGAGMGFAISLVFDFALSSVPLDDAGAASGVLNAFQQAASAVGIAVVGALFFALMPTGEPGGAEWAADSSDAFATAMWLPVGMTLLAFAASFLLPRQAAHHDTAP
ncbi:EmrB/QacA subfamily drug resistance transporter [Allostreptomyces psammosilenae]|uniref:EmrB/QacA subfamily drug resistance transporter n=2 Tax=Allostreptomyces psammosilenae TaxID=1892865 RepID=A0A852ZNN7_9ACTN|nr:MFS transporter [Allostreptomyces psammosilenae]NYI04009.1 EmrB/QacA subfamily drug resistance transporter [Allostreptomyces psammosilenae]